MSEFDRAEALRRMPAAALIENSDLRMDVLDTIGEVPEYFWEAPATSSAEYHNQFARGEHGLWIHVLMAATALEGVVDSYVEQAQLTESEVDFARAAVLLHDGWKYGDSWQSGDGAASDHDLRAADELRERGFPEPVVDAVASHMGPWYDGPDPSTPLEQVVHQADMMGSRRHVTPAVYRAPEELVEVHPELPRCDWDDSEPT
ncbi:HD domain-containing protein [Halobaculum sp. MBLA0147]|uniref:HD domain-containing protein n=1 Tax=Halobaculum sp. MBLA0147 TaxID=3079934 RepID=UPI0035257C74